MPWVRCKVPTCDLKIYSNTLKTKLLSLRIRVVGPVAFPLVQVTNWNWVPPSSDVSNSSRKRKRSIWQLTLDESKNRAQIRLNFRSSAHLQVNHLTVMNFEVRFRSHEIRSRLLSVSFQLSWAAS